MANENSGFALGFMSSERSKEEERKLMEEYEERKKKTDRIEKALMAAGGEIAYRLEKNMQSMSTSELNHTIGALAGIATTMGALQLYAAKPYTSGFCCA